jgi:hypothetical protein
MSAIGFDTLKFAGKLKEAGVPAQQAEAQAEVLGEAFLYNLDQIVTRDYLDARLENVEARFEKRFAELEAGLEKRFSNIDSRHRLHSWMLGVITVVNVIPVLSELLG